MPGISLPSSKSLLLQAGAAGSQRSREQAHVVHTWHRAGGGREEGANGGLEVIQFPDSYLQLDTIIWASLVMSNSTSVLLSHRKF